MQLILRYALCEGALVEPVGDTWVAFSPFSGESTLLNDESAAILEVLELGGGTTRGICVNLAEDSGLDADSLVELVEASWPRLIEAGLVREACSGEPR